MRSGGTRVRVLRGRGRDAGVLALVLALAVGLAVAWILAKVRRRVTDTTTDTAISFMAPWLAYLPAELFHASGVLAVVIAGVLLGHKAPLIQTAPSRSNTNG